MTDVPQNAEYDTDIVVWSDHQTTLLRRAGAGENVYDQVDWGNIAREIEALGKAPARELTSRIGLVLVHLMKTEAAAADEPRAGSEDIIRTQRDKIARLLEDTPSLGPTVSTLIFTELGLARNRVRGDSSNVSYSTDQVLGDWFPPTASCATNMQRS